MRPAIDVLRNEVLFFLDLGLMPFAGPCKILQYGLTIFVKRLLKECEGDGN